MSQYIYTCICRILRRTNSKLRVRFNIKLILRNILINVYDIAVKINFIFEKKRTGKHLPISYKSDNIWHSLGRLQLSKYASSNTIDYWVMIYFNLGIPFTISTTAHFSTISSFRTISNQMKPNQERCLSTKNRLAEKNLLSELLQHFTTNSFP